MTRIEKMQQRLASLEPSQMNIVDESAKHAGHAGARSGAGHYVLTIHSPLFEGKNTLSRHRMIYSALDDMMQSEIHALTIITNTPN